jgi:NADH:ubiquinone oxidoreductase subunit 5 (subunit L)/multisubunit Na+/H+ antiporter MnhA subunit
MNKIGDVFFLLGMMLCFDIFKSLDFSVIFVLAGSFKNVDVVFFGQYVNGLEFLCFFFLIAAMAKSAQIGLHTWLADAMEGPTPVSALIHAATMVTAGVFLIIRCSPIFEFAPITLQIMTAVGAVTAFTGASMALVQYDVKKIIAFSTMSQLGYMFFAAGLSGYSLSLYHLFNHAFFKALLFLSAGSLIHAMSDEQDIRKMGGLCKILPVTYICFLLGSLSLIGFPFTSGFFSKEAILNQAFAKYTAVSLFSYVLGVITAVLTTYYSIRLLW